jgi:hypothetical protein
MEADDLYLLNFFVVSALHSRSHTRAAATRPLQHRGETMRGGGGGLSGHVVDLAAQQSLFGSTAICLE